MASSKPLAGYRVVEVGNSVAAVYEKAPPHLGEHTDEVFNSGASLSEEVP